MKVYPQFEFCFLENYNPETSSMSLSYNLEDDSPSPADFNMRSQLGNGYSIPKSARFSYSSTEEENTVVCPRMGQHSTRCSITHSENELCSNELYSKNLDTLKRNALECSRSDSSRQSFRRKSTKVKEDTSTQPKNDSSNSNDAINESNKIQPLQKREEYIEDNYENLASSEELNDLKIMEEYELNEVCKAIRRSQSRESSIEENMSENVGMDILQALQVIEKGVGDIKTDLNKLQPKKHEVSKRKLIPQPGRHNMAYVKKCEPLETVRSKVKAAMNRALENLDHELEATRRSMLKSSEIGIRKVMKEIHNVNERSVMHLKKACKETVEQFMKDLEPLMKNDVASVCEYASEIHNVSIGEEALERQNNFYGDARSVLDEYTEVTEDANESLERDILNIATKFNGTTEKLDVQGALIEILKHELADMRSTLNKKKF